MSQKNSLTDNRKGYFKKVCLFCSLFLTLTLGVDQSWAALQIKATRSAKTVSSKKSSSSKKVTARPVQDLNLAEQPSGESRDSLRNRGIYSAFGWRSVGKKRSRFHKGIDISALSGSSIQAYDGGTVIFSGRKSGYGICVFIDHGKGLTSRYAHMSKTPLKVGDDIGRGELVGYVGRTGRTTGAHLHFEMLQDSKHLNPTNYIQDGRELVMAAHMGPGAKAFADIPARESASATVAIIKATQKFAEQARLGLPVTFSPSSYNSFSTSDLEQEAVN